MKLSVIGQCLVILEFFFLRSQKNVQQKNNRRKVDSSVFFCFVFTRRVSLSFLHPVKELIVCFNVPSFHSFRVHEGEISFSSSPPKALCDGPTAQLFR